MPAKGQPTGLLHYAVAIVAVGVAVAVRFALPVSGRNVFLLFYPVVAGAAWYGGFGPGLLAAALGAAAGNYFFISPGNEFSLGPTEMLETALFFVIAAFVAWLIAATRTARYRADAAAQAAAERGERLRVTLAGIGDAVIATDETGHVTFLNAVAETLTGWKDADARGRPLDEVFKIVNQHTRVPVVNPVQRVLKEGKATGLANHTMLIARDGTERLIEDSAAPVRLADDRTIGTVLVFRDVTAQRRAQAAAAAASEQLRLALEAGRMAAWSWDVKTNQISWSETFEALHGLAPGTFGGTFDALLQLVHPEDRETFRAALQRSLSEAGAQSGRAEYEAEFRVVLPGTAGTADAVRWMHGLGRVFPGPDGKPARLIGLRYDITERKAEELRRQLLADATRDFAAAQPDLDAVSAAVERHLARARQATGQAAEDGDLLEELQQRADAALENARLLAAERQARVEAEAATASRDQFLSIASHELRTPVTTIKGHAQMVLRGQTRGRLGEERLRESLQNINAAADRLNLLVQDLLDVSRLRTGRLSLHLEPVDPGALVREVLTRHAGHVAEGRRFSTKIAAGLPTITADAHRIEQVLVNLIGNAAKYSARGSTVHVTVSAEEGVVTKPHGGDSGGEGVRRRHDAGVTKPHGGDGGDAGADESARRTRVAGVRIEVRDQGLGLPPGAAESIFEPFGRATNVQHIAGMGLGLYICRGIVSQHGGRIGVESPGPNRGTTAWFWLPQTPHEAQAAEDSGAPPAPDGRA